MATNQQFRTQFSGFHREDVVHYLDYLNQKHQEQLSQLNAERKELQDRVARAEGLEEQLSALEAENARLQAENARLQAENARLQAQPSLDEQEEQALLDQIEELRQKLAQEQARSAGLTEELALARCSQAPAVPAAEALDLYRRSEEADRSARIQSELVYHQTVGVLTQATVRVESAAREVTGLADAAMEQLTRLQMAVADSKQSLQEAAEIMNVIRPNRS